MRKALLAISILVATGTATAEYTIKSPLEQAQGGSLPNGSITFTNQEPTTPTAPILDCVNNPEENPTECQERLNAWEIFADSKDPVLSKIWNSLHWYNKFLTNIPTEPYPLTSVNYLYLNNNQLTNVDGLSNLTSVNYLSLNNNQLTNINGLSNLTSVNYLSLSSNQLTNINILSNLTSVNNLILSMNQLTNINGLSNLTSVFSLYLSNNQLTNVDGLSNLTSVKNLNLNNNQLTNINGLSNLTSVTELYLSSNQLTNVDGLSNLTSVNRIALDSNQLTNINGFANLEIITNIRIDATYAGPKLAATTIFCSINSPDRFEGGYAQKTQLCESP